MNNHFQSDNSVQQVLQLIRNLRIDSNKCKQLSSIDFSGKSSWRQPLKIKYQSSNRLNVFQKLYNQSRQKQHRKCLLEYQSRRSKQQKNKNQCTFSPNISYKLKTSQNNYQSFYDKNISWLQRKDKIIKIKQCQKNQQNIRQLTFTPRINKQRKKTQKQTSQNKGVDTFLKRQNKAKKINQFIQERKKNPYSHIWNIKKGYFSNMYTK